jgi:hypothetical protein
MQALPLVQGLYDLFGFVLTRDNNPFSILLPTSASIK